MKGTHPNIELAAENERLQKRVTQLESPQLLSLALVDRNKAEERAESAEAENERLRKQADELLGTEKGKEPEEYGRKVQDPQDGKPSHYQVAWVFRHIRNHFLHGGTYRYLIYDRMGFNETAYTCLYEAGGMLISNTAYDLAEAKSRAESAEKSADEWHKGYDERVHEVGLLNVKLADAEAKVRELSRTTLWNECDKCKQLYDAKDRDCPYCQLADEKEEHFDTKVEWHREQTHSHALQQRIDELDKMLADKTQQVLEREQTITEMQDQLTTTRAKLEQARGLMTKAADALRTFGLDVVLQEDLRTAAQEDK